MSEWVDGGVEPSDYDLVEDDMSEWTSVEERMPERGIWVLIDRPPYHEVAKYPYVHIAMRVRGEWQDEYGHSVPWIVSYWMSLPEPPEDA